MTFLEMFERELEIHGITWCKGECDVPESTHRNRAYATAKTRTVHMISKIERRSTLLDGLHEIGHIVANTPGMKRWQREKSATEWSYKRMRELGVSIPRKSRRDYNNYVARMKSWGKNIAAGRKARV
jgi:hypothetical protein